MKKKYRCKNCGEETNFERNEYSDHVVLLCLICGVPWGEEEIVVS